MFSINVFQQFSKFLPFLGLDMVGYIPVVAHTDNETYSWLLQLERGTAQDAAHNHRLGADPT